VPDKGTRGVNVVVRIYEQVLPLSLTKTEYDAGNNPVTAEPVNAVGVHVYENGPTPPEALIVTEPRLAHVIENVLKLKTGIGFTLTVEVADAVQVFAEVPMQVYIVLAFSEVLSTAPTVPPGCQV
jgi:hypothetical protein